ncbi:hypothetical protein [Streptomyces sp. NBC_01363]|nr:hypothetical protein [Streptomyces sp. NBC_01363]MCX4736530.1 hypothetical protein [Streptomyces sp. NBC_01363]
MRIDFHDFRVRLPTHLVRLGAPVAGTGGAAVEPPPATARSPSMDA